MALSQPQHPVLDELVAGDRVNLRRRRPDGLRDLLGFVVAVDPESVTVEDRTGIITRVPRQEVVVGRRVPIARGRDPLRTPLSELDALAAAAGLRGSCWVARLSDLLAFPGPGTPPAEPTAVLLSGEWVVSGRRPDWLEVAWWATRRGARSYQLRVDDPASELLVRESGFTRRD